MVLFLLMCAAIAATGACSGAPRDPGIATANTAAASASTPPSGAAGAEGDLTAFTHCMAEHGIPDANTLPTAPPGGTNSPQFQTWKDAMRACESKLPAQGPEKAPDQATLEKLREFAVCMRAHDIEMTDPLPNGNMKINGRFEHVTRAQLEADPVYQAAMAACKDKLPDEETKG